MPKQKIKMTPHPNKVLIRISKEAHQEIFSKWIKDSEGNKVQLFTDMEADEGADKKFTQNVSCGTVLAVGKNIKDIFPTDILILDYLASNSADGLVGFVNGDMIIALDPRTIYHETSAPPAINMRRAFVKGDFEELSKILGAIRGDRLVSFAPYVFLTKEDDTVHKVGSDGVMYAEKQDIVERTVLSAFVESGFKDGDTVVIKEMDLFFRNLSDREISVCFFKEILGTK